VEVSEPARQTNPCGECGKPVDMEFDYLCTACETAAKIWDEAFDDCGMMPNGQCTKAGSEECDWECGRLS
jgi:NMD protein affecting ribosome stability and mRNA decay